jgi:ankyrin repeat protein
VAQSHKRAAAVAELAEVAEAIFDAIDADDEARVRALVDANPTVLRARDEDGTSPLLYARYRGKHDLVDAIRGATPALDVFEAAALGDVDRVRELVHADPALANAHAPDGFHALGLAAFFGQPEVVRFLLEHGADVDRVARNEQIRTTALQAAAASGDFESARLLLGAGADANRAQAGGFTALHAAAANGDEPLAGLLLAHGADRDARIDEDKTAAEIAAERGHADLALRLS